MTRTMRRSMNPGMCGGDVRMACGLRWILRACVLLWLFSLLPAAAAQTIHAIQEDGRTIYVNADAAPPAPAPQAKAVPRFEYWSNTEKRWKPIPPISSGTLRRANQAVAEVQRAVRVEPAAGKPAGPVTFAEIDRIIESAAARHHVDPNLVRAVIKVESNFNPSAVSRKGAMGLMQLMPATARRFNVNNPFDPRQNVEAGVQHLKRLLDNFGGDVGLSLAAYNAGEGAVNRRNGVPPYRETQFYLRRVKNLYGDAVTTLVSTTPLRVSRDSHGVLTISNVD
jgi:soluble lytic murein transglycosylase-like protein